VQRPAKTTIQQQPSAT